MTGRYPPNHPRLESVSSFLQRAGVDLTVTYRRVFTHSPRCRCPECPPACDCPMNPYHRWNCALTPIWAQTIRDQDCNPWTVITGSREWNQLIKDYVFNRRKGSQ